MNSEELAHEVAQLDWYHTMELAPGVVTPGWMDTRGIVDQVPFPASLDGARCLDVATFNGFWAFEMERRGASDVIGIDVLDPDAWDWPPRTAAATVAAISQRHAGGRGFELAKEALGSRVERLDRSVYDLDPADIGEFDVVYVGSLLIHLRDPLAALQRIRAVCRGTLIVVDGIDPLLSILFRKRPVAALEGHLRPWWWYPNVAALGRMIEGAGFDLVGAGRRLYMPPGAAWPLKRFNLRALRDWHGRYNLTVAWKGDPHAIFVARAADGVRIRA